MRYGLPYKGSKNKIAAQIVEQLPPAECFVDLFAGGYAVTHAAMLSGKYKRFIINDIDFAPIMLFKDAVAGKYHDEKRWISRDDFFSLKDTDPYVKLCWSFGNNGRNYLYSGAIEPWKKALHYVRVLKDFSLLAEMDIISDGSRHDIRTHHEEYKQKYIVWLKKRIKLHTSDEERLQSLERLESLQSLQSLERLQSYSRDYQDVPIPSDSVIYCDIPYIGTDGYSIGGFDHERFYAWAAKHKNLYVSEYQMLPPFEAVWTVEKAQLLNGKGSGKKVHEQLFVNKEKTTPEATLFDFMEG